MTGPAAGQNRSHAVMQQRSEPHDSLDDFPTQPWGTRALCEVVLPQNALSVGRSVWEPACNRGYMARPLAEYFSRVDTSDIFDYSVQWPDHPQNGPGQQRVTDFLFPGSESGMQQAQGVDWIITNPPFRLAEEFIQRARAIANLGVAMLVRTAFLEGVGRYQRLFRKSPPTVVAQFTERLPMVKGRIDRKASTATSYAWLVWAADNRSPRPFFWIPPCRARLERDSDYVGSA